MRPNDSCRIGLLAEIKFCEKAIQAGYDTFIPLGHSQKIDLIICKPSERPISIQIKKARQVSPDRWRICTKSGNKYSANKGVTYCKYKAGDFDVLAAYIAELDQWSLWWLDEVDGKSSIRWNPANGRKNNFDILSTKQLTN